MNESTKLSARSQRQPTRPRDMSLVLVLQGGGALGAYQAGVFQALQEHDFGPDWVVGTSIGAINGAVIAGNAPEDRVPKLRELWEGLAQPNAWDMAGLADALPTLYSGTSILQAMTIGNRGMFEPRWWPNTATEGTSESPSFYDTGPLRELLGRLVHFGHINEQAVRLNVSAVEVTTGERVAFDNAQQALTVDHILASGAMPPGLPAVRIDGRLYWDGGVYANTPLDTVLADWRGRDALCFVVNLWDPQGNEPRSIAEVEARHKQLGYTSHAYQHIKQAQNTHYLRNVIRRLYKRMPDELHDDPEVMALAAGLGEESAMHIERIGYPDEDQTQYFADVDFSPERLRQRWDQGYRDGQASLERADWLEPASQAGGLEVHDFLSETS